MRSQAGATAGPMPVSPPAHDKARSVTDDEPQHERHVASHIFNIVMLLVGGVALWWMIRSLGWDQFIASVTSVGAWFAVILALDLVALCCDAAALQAFMRPEARMVTYWRVLGAQMSGRAINVLTPGGALGEATKLTMLMTHAPRARVLSSIVLLNLSQFYLSVLTMIIGTPITFLLVDVPNEMKVLVGIGFAIMLPVVVILGVLVKRGAVSTIVNLVRRTRLISAERADRWKDRLVDVDRHIRELHQNRSHGTWKGFLWVLASRAALWSATFLLFYAAGVALTPTTVIGYLSIGLLIQWVSNIVPMGLGIMDGGNYALFAFLGATGLLGVAITMINRARSVTVAILGLGAMALVHLFNRLGLARMHRKLAALRAKAHGAS